MTLAIMQPYFLPYIGYLQLMQAVDRFVFYDDVAFINRGWVNRNRILVNGQEYLFTVPLKDASQNRRICDIALSDDPKWRGKLLQTIGQSYRKAPHYSAVMPLLEKIINFAADNIAHYVRHSFTVLLPYVGIETDVVASSTVYGNGHLRAQERILDICRQEGATRYVNPIGGTDLYDKPTFAEHGVQLQFHRSKPVSYPQFRNEFVPWLSVIDVLMFNEPAAVRAMLDDYVLE